MCVVLCDVPVFVPVAVVYTASSESRAGQSVKALAATTRSTVFQTPVLVDFLAISISILTTSCSSKSSADMSTDT